MTQAIPSLPTPFEPYTIRRIGIKSSSVATPSLNRMAIDRVERQYSSDVEVLPTTHSHPFEARTTTNLNNRIRYQDRRLSPQPISENEVITPPQIASTQLHPSSSTLCYNRCDNGSVLNSPLPSSTTFCKFPRTLTTSPAVSDSDHPGLHVV